MSNTVLNDITAGIVVMSIMKEISSLEEFPRVTAIDTIEHDDGVIYNGRIAINPGKMQAQKEDLEGILHQLKHCFKGDYKKSQDWMVEGFRANSGKHSRISITYILYEDKDGIVIDFYRSMAEGASGAHQLHKITSQNSTDSHQYEPTTYNGGKYFVVPMTVREANRLMNLFGTMFVQALEAYWLERAISEGDTDTIVESMESPITAKTTEAVETAEAQMVMMPAMASI